MIRLLAPVEEPFSLIQPYKVIDVSPIPMNPENARQLEWMRLESLHPIEFTHPDLWHDGRWVG